MSKKKILALAIAAALPGTASAVVNFSTATGNVSPPTGIPTYAQEVTIPVGGLTIPNDHTALPLDLQFNYGFGASILGSQRYIRINYPGVKPSRNILATDFVGFIAAGNPTAPPTFSVVSAGTTSDEYVIVQLTANAPNGFAPNDGFIFHVPATNPNADGVKITVANTKSVSYSFYETATNAVNQTSPLSTVSGTWFQFGPGLNLACDTNGLNVENIDPTTPKNFITSSGDTNTQFVNLTAGLLPGSFYNPVSGLPLTVLDYLPYSGAQATTFKLSGNTSFFNATSGVRITAGPFDPTIVKAVAGTATWTTGSASPALVLPTPSGFNTGTLVELNADGSTAMTDGSYTMTVTPGTGALSTTPITFPCGSLAFAGSSDRVDFVLTPNAANKQYVRITNPSDTAGAVTVNMWNDAGLKVTFPLSAVKTSFDGGAHNLPGILNAQSSTTMVDINSFYNAAVATNAAFSNGVGIDGTAGKLRIEVRGNFGDNHVDGHYSVGGKPSTVRLKNGIYIQAISSATVYQSH